METCTVKVGSLPARIEVVLKDPEPPPLDYGKVYLDCSFKYEGGPFVEGQNWRSADVINYPCEVGHWDSCDYSGNTPTGGDMRLVKDPVRPDRLCLEFELSQPGVRPLNANQHTKLWNKAERGWATEGKVEEAYYTGEFYLPQSIQHGSNILQWGHRSGKGGMPIAKIFVGSDGCLYYRNKLGEVSVHNLGEAPLNQWVSICAFLHQSSSYTARDGAIKIWINQSEVYSDDNQRLRGNDPSEYQFMWSINNYGDEDEPRGTKILWRNIMVTEKRTF